MAKQDKLPPLLKNKDSVTDLLMGLFNHYHSFDYGKNVISIFLGNTKASECTLEDLAASPYLRMARILDSCKVDAMAREAKMDTIVGHKTVALCITFGTIEDKNAFKDVARSLELNAKDSFPKQYAKQKDRALMYYKNNILLNNKGTWAKADTRLGRLEDPLYITIPGLLLNFPCLLVTLDPFPPLEMVCFVIDHLPYPYPNLSFLLLIVWKY